MKLSGRSVLAYGSSVASLAETSLNHEQRALLERFAAELRSEKQNPPRAIWLFGSRARGEQPAGNSDVDVLVVVDEDSWQAKSHIHDTLLAVARAMRLEALTWSFAVHVHTPSWLTQRREVHSFFIDEVDRNKVAP